MALKAVTSKQRFSAYSIVKIFSRQVVITSWCPKMVIDGTCTVPFVYELMRTRYGIEMQTLSMEVFSEIEISCDTDEDVGKFLHRPKTDCLSKLFMRTKASIRHALLFLDMSF